MGEDECVDEGDWGVEIVSKSLFYKEVLDFFDVNSLDEDIGVDGDFIYIEFLISRLSSVRYVEGE